MSTIRNYHYSFPYRHSYGLIVLLLILCVMSWEYQKVDASVVGSDIPEEAIRLRILANSDRTEDQLIKAIVRDEVVAAMNSWITEPLTIEQARRLIHEHETEINTIVENTLQLRGFDYNFSVELGLVDFPTKMYGSKIYPAGQYEALLITIGEGKGLNWWCVLFPPLCFIDSVSGEAAAAPAEVSVASAQVDHENNANSEAEGQQQDEASTDDLEVKFFIVEWFQAIGAWFSSLFA